MGCSQAKAPNVAEKQKSEPTLLGAASPGNQTQKEIVVAEAQTAAPQETVSGVEAPKREGDAPQTDAVKEQAEQAEATVTASHHEGEVLSAAHAPSTNEDRQQTSRPNDKARIRVAIQDLPETEANQKVDGEQSHDNAANNNSEDATIAKPVDLPLPQVTVRGAPSSTELCGEKGCFSCCPSAPSNA